LVADLLAAAILPDVFETPQLYTAPELWGWLILYGFSLYNDFAGYTSIVRGVSGLFGLELSSNFQHPYFARSFTEFWNRWHITLSHWLRDYIYFPLSRILLRRNPSRRNLANLVIPPLITMLVSGLWHGFDAHMFLWGGLHGLYQILERLPSLWRPITPPQLQPAWRQAASTVLIVFLIMLAWVPFRMEVPVALEFWRGLFDLSSSAFRFRRILLFAPVIIAAVAFDWLQHHYNDEYIVLRWPRLAQAACLAAMVWFIFVLLPADGGEPFVYQGF
jgi:alginate O-acetyltransferase complex protein AlgI